MQGLQIAVRNTAGSHHFLSAPIMERKGKSSNYLSSSNNCFGHLILIFIVLSPERKRIFFFITFHPVSIIFATGRNESVDIEIDSLKQRFPNFFLSCRPLADCFCFHRPLLRHRCKTNEAV